MIEGKDETETESKDLVEQPPVPKIKTCFVKLQKIDVNEFNSDSDSSVDDLPPLPYLLSVRSSKPKSKKSTKQLMEEHENLAKDIKIDNVSNDNIEEKIKRLEVAQNDEVEDTSLSPAPVMEGEKKNNNILCVCDNFQYFTVVDVTPELCGYDRKSKDLTEYEKTMLSFKRVELETVLSSFLVSSNVSCISDCKSFTTFLLRNLSIQNDVASIQACYKVLLMILLKHPNGKNLKFSSAEIFMLLFNYGTDIDSFKFLSRRPDIRRYLGEPMYKNMSYNKIPEMWMFNFKIILSAVINLIIHCEIEVKDLCNTIIYFMWMSLDSSLFQENIFSKLRECIYVSLDRIPKDKWPRVMREIAWTFISMEFSSTREKWSNIYHMAESVPVVNERGLELRKYISVLALTCLGEVDLTKGSSEEVINAEVTKTLNGFSLSELQSLLQKLVEVDPEVISFATKFLDLSISHLKATDKDFIELCYILKQCESTLSERAHEAKAHFLKIHARLKIRLGKSVIYKVNSEDDERIDIVAKEKETALSEVAAKNNKRTWTEVKQEPDPDIDIENVPNPFHHIKVKQEPVQEPVPKVTGHNSEKIISFSEFDCEDDNEDLDFLIDKPPDIHMNLVPVKTERIVDLDLNNSVENGNSIMDMPQLVDYSGCDVGDQECVASSKFTANTVCENTCNSTENSIICNPPLLKAIIPLNLSDNLTLPVEINQNNRSNNHENTEEFVNSLKTHNDPLTQSSECESGLIENSHIGDEFVNDGTRFSHNFVEHGPVADSKSRFENNLPGEDILIDNTNLSHMDIPVDKSTVSYIDETSSYERPNIDSVSRIENAVSCEDVSIDKRNLSYMDVQVDKLAISYVDETCSHERPIANSISRLNDLLCEDVSINKTDKTAVSYMDVSVDNPAVSCVDVSADKPTVLHGDISVIEPATFYENILVEKPSLSLGEKSVAFVVGASAESDLESHLPLENNDLSRKSPVSPQKYMTENSVMFHQSNISEISVTDEAICPENIIKQSVPIDLLDNYKSPIYNDLPADNIFGEGTKDETSADSIVGNSSFAEKDSCPPDVEFSSEADHSDPLTKLFKSLSLPEGTEIVPVKTIIDSTIERELSKPFVHSADMDEEVVFVAELNETTSHTKKCQNNTVKTIESSDSDDKELEILLVKSVASSSKSENKSKPKHSESKSKYIEELADEEIAYVTEVNVDVNKMKSNLVRSESSESKVCNRKGVIISPKINSSRGVESSSKTKVSKSTNSAVISDTISDDDGIVFVRHVDSPLKNKSSTSQCNETVVKDIERIGSPLKKFTESENIILHVTDINLFKGNPKIDSTASSVENSIVAENEQVSNQNSDVHPECMESVKSNTELLDGEVMATMNEAILKKFADLEDYLKLTFVKEHESGKSTSPVGQASTNIDAVTGYNNMQKEDSDIDAVIGHGSMQKGDSSKLHLEKEDKSDTEKNLSEKAGQSVVEVKVYPKDKLIKRKSTDDNIENKVSETGFINNEVINTDVSHVVNNLITSVVSDEDSVDKNVYSVPHCTKLSPNNVHVPKFNLSLNQPVLSVEYSPPANESNSSSSTNYLSEKSNLEAVDVSQEALNRQVGEENLKVEYLQPSKTKSVVVKSNSTLDNYRRLNALFNSRSKKLQKRNILLESNQTKGTQLKSKNKLPGLPERNTQLFQKRKIEFCSPSPKVQKHSRNSFADSGASGLSDHSSYDESITSTLPKFSPKKSFVSTKSFSNKKSPSKYFDYKLKKNNALKNLRKDLFTKTGINLTNVLRERCISSSSDQPEHCSSTSSVCEIYNNRSKLNLANILKEQLMSSSSNQPEKNSSTSSKTEIYISSDSDSDIQELFVDPKRYKDHECMIVYESEEQIVLSDD